MSKELLLAIDSSTDLTSIALAEGEQIIAELTWFCHQNHTIELMPNIQYLLKQSSASLDSLGAVIIAQGPGSYNGLRVGMSVAKGLAFGLHIPIIGTGTLEIEAYQHMASRLTVCPLMDAGRGELVTALYSGKGNKWRQIIEEHITTMETLCQSIHSRTIFCGHTPKYASALKDNLGELAVFPPPPSQLRRGGYLAALGWLKLKQGIRDDPNTIQPVYMRKPHITQSKVKHNIIGEEPIATGP